MKLIKEVQAANQSFQGCHIRGKHDVERYTLILVSIPLQLTDIYVNICIGAAYTYYKTLTQEDSLERRGMSTDRKKKRRHREQIACVSSFVMGGISIPGILGV